MKEIRDMKFNIMKFKIIYYTRTGYPNSYMLKMVRLWQYSDMGSNVVNTDPIW